MISLSTSFREVSLETTWKNIQAVMKAAGITRISDITGLDTIGVPVIQAIRPASRYPITVFSGKGLTELEAKVSGCMEAIESYASENYQPSLMTSRYKELTSRKSKVLNPSTLILPSDIDVERNEFDWVPTSVLELNDDKANETLDMWIPKEAVLMPCQDPQWTCSTNGIASGNTVHEALLHALFEVIERDAESLALVAAKARNVHSDYLELPPIRDLIDRVQNSGLEIFLKDMTSDLEVPTFNTVIRDPERPSPWFISGGTGTHLDPIIALMRSIAEAIQSRAGMIAGAREDLREETIKNHIPIKEFEQTFAYWLSDQGETARTYSMPNTRSVEKATQKVLSRLNQKGFTAFWNRMTVDAVRFFEVVRVVVPGLEMFCIDKSRIGKRLIAAEPMIENYRANF